MVYNNPVGSTFFFLHPVCRWKPMTKGLYKLTHLSSNTQREVDKIADLQRPVLPSFMFSVYAKSWACLLQTFREQGFQASLCNQDPPCLSWMHRQETVALCVWFQCDSILSGRGEARWKVFVVCELKFRERKMPYSWKFLLGWRFQFSQPQRVSNAGAHGLKVSLRYQEAAAANLLTPQY